MGQQGQLVPNLKMINVYRHGVPHKYAQRRAAGLECKNFICTFPGKVAQDLVCCLSPPAAGAGLGRQRCSVLGSPSLSSTVNPTVSLAHVGDPSVRPRGGAAPTACCPLEKATELLQMPCCHPWAGSKSMQSPPLSPDLCKDKNETVLISSWA